MFTLFEEEIKHKMLKKMNNHLYIKFLHFRDWHGHDWQKKINSLPLIIINQIIIRPASGLVKYCKNSKYFVKQFTKYQVSINICRHKNKNSRLAK